MEACQHIVWYTLKYQLKWLGWRSGRTDISHTPLPPSEDEGRRNYRAGICHLAQPFQTSFLTSDLFILPSECLCLPCTGNESHPLGHAVKTWLLLGWDVRNMVRFAAWYQQLPAMTSLLKPFVPCPTGQAQELLQSSKSMSISRKDEVLCGKCQGHREIPDVISCILAVCAVKSHFSSPQALFLP